MAKFEELSKAEAEKLIGTFIVHHDAMGWCTLYHDENGWHQHFGAPKLSNEKLIYAIHKFPGEYRTVASQKRYLAAELRREAREKLREAEKLSPEEKPS